MDKVTVVVQAPDQLMQLGAEGALATHSGIEVLGSEERERAQVVLMAVDTPRPPVIAKLRRDYEEFGTPVVLVVDDLNDKDLLAMVECKVMAVLPRSHVTPGRLTHSVLTAAAGGALMPPALLGQLIAQVQRLHREFVDQSGTNLHGLAPREIDVLRLVAEGNDTDEVAAALGYSARTIKGVISALVGRLQLRNRSHAVAYAMRAGLI
ncbi:LuxR C-terminal-related transcriptional regulator [Lentzea sp. NPDC059081]|uniref:helix-turn-helix transcriptional regulator n=1 Tax=Lentzea sp. NPDC059081 TaxID=3346719 RepID=UPI0036BBB528